MKNQFSTRSRLFYLFIPLVFSSCYSIKNVFNEKAEIGFFEKAGTGNIHLSASVTENILAASLSASYALVEGIMIGGSVHSYSNSMFNDSESGSFYFRGKEALFKGRKFSAFVGHYKNSGVMSNKYSEFRLGIGAGSNTLTTYRRPGINVKLPDQRFDYNATSLYLQYGIGGRKKNTAFAGGIKLQYHLLNKNIPIGGLNEEKNDYNLSNTVLTLNPFMLFSFGMKKVGGELFFGASLDPIHQQVAPNLGLSVLYRFNTKLNTGQKQPAREISI